MFTYNKLLQACLEKLVVDADASRMFDGGKRVLHHIFDIAIDIDLLQRDSHGAGFGIGEHHEFDVGGSLIVMEFVLRSSVGEETANSY